MLRLGFLANFISEPVLKGFIVGLALTIIVGQIPKLLGIPKGNGDFFEQAWHIVTHLGHTQAAALLVGVASLAVIVALAVDLLVGDARACASSLGTLSHMTHRAFASGRRLRLRFRVKGAATGGIGLGRCALGVELAHARVVGAVSDREGNPSGSRTMRFSDGAAFHRMEPEPVVGEGRVALAAGDAERSAERLHERARAVSEVADAVGGDRTGGSRRCA